MSSRLLHLVPAISNRLLDGNAHEIVHQIGIHVYKAS